MIAFRIQYRPGVPIFEQIVYAAKRAMVAGQLRPGDAFPSVRALGKEFRINPNTAAKVVTHLVAEGLLETRPGIGTVVAPLPAATVKERTQLLGHEIEELVVEAMRLGIRRDEMVAAVVEHWGRLGRHPSNEEATKTKQEER